MNRLAGLLFLIPGAVLTLLFGLLTAVCLIAPALPGLVVSVPGLVLAILCLVHGTRLCKESPPPDLRGNADVAALRESLLALNDEEEPFRVRAAKPEENAHLVAEWKVVDAKWIAYIQKARLRQVFAVFLRFDTERREVRTVDVDQSVETGLLSIGGSAFRGQRFGKRYGRAWGLREDGTWGEIYRYRFDTATIKKPLRSVVEASGWRWKRVFWGRL